MAPRQQIVSMSKSGGRQPGDFRPRRMGDPDLEPLPTAVAPSVPRRMGDEVEELEAPKGSPALESAESLPVVARRMGEPVAVVEPSRPSDSSPSVPTPSNQPPVPPIAPPLPRVPVSDASAEKAPLTTDETGNQPSSQSPSLGNPTPRV